MGRGGIEPPTHGFSVCVLIRRMVQAALKTLPVDRRLRQDILFGI